MFDRDNFYFQLNSFIGFDHFPDREYKTTNYFDRNVFFAGWKYRLRQNSKFWFDLTYNDKFYAREILLNRLGVSYEISDFIFSAKYDDLKYGAESQIYALQVKDRFYDLGVIENYQFNGGEIIFHKKKYAVKGLLAGNSFHYLIGNLELNWKHKNLKAKIYYLFVGRNEEYNTKNHSFGIETKFEIPYLTFYQSFVYQYLPNREKGDKIKTLWEIIVRPIQYFEFGSNLFLESFELSQKQNSQSQSFLKFKLASLENYFFYRYNKIEEFSSDYLNIEYSFLHLYPFSKHFMMGINASLFTPDFDDNYYEIGLQVNFSYEKNI